MNQRDNAAAANGPQMVGERYRIHSALGRGGMGTVYAVTDTVSGQQLALKRLRDRGEQPAEFGIVPFRREYELLAELSHPSIIQVYDYGLDPDGPYYTMELLDGVTMAERGQLLWRDACTLLRDIASSLAVIHSRRLVHRDVTLRNIQYTRQGRCKLLDFGAVARMGVHTPVVGTPPYLPPEALSDRPLDARADLYALGATLYHLLTGRHAYPATRIEQLRDCWSTPVLSPHELSSQVPLALSQLTMALLSLDPFTRPHSAAEIMDRLSAMAGLDLRESGAVRRGYLATPALAGRARQLQQVRGFLARADEKRGGVLLIGGPSGVGRSRMLETCAMQARLAGATVLQVGAGDPSDAFGVLRALTISARQCLPDHDASLQRLTELTAHTGSPALKVVGDAGQHSFAKQRQEVQDALRRWCVAVAARRPLLIAIDDIDRADEPSVACLAALSEACLSSPLLIALSAASDRTSRAHVALDWLSGVATRIELPSLARGQVLELLSSVFGDVPNVAVLADRLHARSGGHPQGVMQLAEHLLDRGTVRYEAGAFIVPEYLNVDQLPSTLQDALQARLATLEEAARDVVRAFMFDVDGWYAPSELAVACELSVSALETLLCQLTGAGILVRDRERVGLKQRAFGNAMLALCDTPIRMRWHRRLVHLFQQRADAARVALHLWAAGEREAAALTLVEHSVGILQGTRSDPTLLGRLVATLPADFIDLLCQVIDACAELGVSKRAATMLRLTCLRLGALTCDGREVPHLYALIAQMRVDSGLAAWERLDSIADPVERRRQALLQTQAQYDALPERERGLAVQEAFPVFAAVRGHAITVYTQTRDFGLAAALPSLAPLVPLSPVLAVTDALITAVGHLMAGRYQHATAGYSALIELLDGPARGVIDSTGDRMNRYGTYLPLGLIAAERGHPSALTWADKLEVESLFHVSAWRVRMQYHRARGDVDDAERCRRQADLVRIASKPHEHYRTGAVLPELSYAIATEDLVGIKRVLQELDEIVARFAGWEPVRLLARGEYCRLRGDHPEAITHLERSLEMSVLGQDLNWQAAAAACLGAFYAARRLDEGLARGRQWLQLAEQADLRDSANPIAQALAIIEAALGHGEAAIAHAESTLHWVNVLEFSGVRAGIAHEARARVAMLLSDRAGFELHLASCARHFRAGRSAGLWARYERIERDARAIGFCVPERAPEPASQVSSFDPTELQHKLGECRNPQQRAEAILEVLASQSTANGGALYLGDGKTMNLRAVSGAFAVRTQLDNEVETLCTQARSVPPQGAEQTLETPWGGDCEHHSFLLSHAVAGTDHVVEAVVGVALLRGTRDRRPTPARELLSFCARVLFEAGDAIPLTVA